MNIYLSVPDIPNVFFQYKKTSKYACGTCVNDDFMYKYIEESGINRKCDFCNQYDKCVSVNELSERLHFYLNYCYDINENDSPCVGGEFIYDHGESLFEIIDRYLNFVPELKNELLSLFDAASFYEKKITMFEYGGIELDIQWENFLNLVFNLNKTPTQLLNEKNTEVWYILDSIGHLAEHFALIETLCAGEEVFRVREGKHVSIDEIGPPPVNLSKSNRFSQKGEVCFYASSDIDICKREIQLEKDSTYSVGIWRTSCDLLVLDLTKDEYMKKDLYSFCDDSILNVEKMQVFPVISFFLDWLAEMSKPIKKNDDTRGYEPTQIVSEYFRKYFKTKDVKQIAGIRYRSSMDTHGINYAFFCNQNQCGMYDNVKQDQWLSLCSSKYFS